MPRIPYCNNHPGKGARNPASKLESRSGISVNFGSTPRLQWQATSNQRERSRPGSKAYRFYNTYKWRWVDLEPVWYLVGEIEFWKTSQHTWGDAIPARQHCFCITAISYDPPCLSASWAHWEILANGVSRVSLFNVYNMASSSTTTIRRGWAWIQ